jgi:hypothetical protein
MDIFGYVVAILLLLHTIILALFNSLSYPRLHALNYHIYHYLHISDSRRSPLERRPKGPQPIKRQNTQSSRERLLCL